MGLGKLYRWYVQGPEVLVSLPLWNIGKRASAFKIESANGAGAVLERTTSMKTVIASVVARNSLRRLVETEVEALGRNRPLDIRVSNGPTEAAQL